MDGIRILIVDDQPLVRRGLRSVFEGLPGIVTVGESPDGLDAVRDVRRLRPDVVLMDVNMPRMDGLEATRRICAPEKNSGTRVIILTMYDRDEHVFEALRTGASGFLLKDSPTSTLEQAVREVAAGEALLSPSVTRRLIGEFARRPSLSTPGAELSHLTDRELDVFRLLVCGHSNQEIARMLVLGESTVKSHVQHLYQKLGVRDRVQVVIYAYENGLIDRRLLPA
ncbi:response regulator transcription factor [Actinoplanes hulinensis]|uniref:Response regulator transcription factor n=1 Tax=Actinoplanes hulinensis TaxID=1144547 RepID=A0ABS7B561_9ACTN|nr:response regulator transcription factor [Actinoplanes hulinensis]MBW6436100.1 response regulator transcription factor [Actinoplanes hulinensis]